MVSIRITDSGEFLDTEGVRIAYNLEAFDLKSLQFRKGEFSIDFDLPDTPRNRRLLDYATEDFLSGNTTYQRIDIELLQNGELIKAGYLRIVARERSISATFYSGASDWITLLEGSIRDVDLSDFDHIFRNADIEAGLIKTSEYVYPLIDYGTWENIDGLTGDRVQTTDLKPAIYMLDLIRIMFREIDWKVDGSLIDDLWFKRLVIPFASGGFNHIGSWADDRSLETLKQAAQSRVGALDNVTFPSELQDTDNWNGSDIYTTAANEPLNANTKVTCTFSAATTSPLLEIHVNDVAVATTTITGAGEFTVEFEQAALVGSIKIKMNAAAGTWTIDSGTLVIEAGAEILDGAQFEIRSALPDISKKDLMRYIFIHRGIVPTTDNFSKTLTLSFFRDIIKTTQDDWTEKIDGDKKVDFAELFESYGQNTWLRYAEGSGDKKLVKFKAANDMNYGDGRFIIANEFLDKDVDLYESPFAGTINYQSLNGRAYLPYIPYSANGVDFTEVQDPTARILYVIPNIDIVYFIENGSIWFNNPVLEQTQGTFAFFAKKQIPAELVFPPTPDEGVDEGLAFDTPDDTIYSVGTIDRYMDNLERILNNGKIETFRIRLTEVDVREFDITKPVFISQEGGAKLYYKNKLRNFEDGKASQDVELIPFE